MASERAGAFDAVIPERDLLPNDLGASVTSRVAIANEGSMAITIIVDCSCTNPERARQHHKTTTCQLRILYRGGQRISRSEASSGEALKSQERSSTNLYSWRLGVQRLCFMKAVPAERRHCMANPRRIEHSER